jgi:ubiquinone/menaquinone biosynthesis C-methylase UbiE
LSSKQSVRSLEAETTQALTLRPVAPATIPAYLQNTYWWAYLHPRAVHIFERQWLVNLILWGNFARLRDAALSEIGAVIQGRVLQVACVYGDFTEHMVRRLGPKGSVDVIDVAPIQINNLHAKLKLAGVDHSRVNALLQDSSDLHFLDGSHDDVVVFFLLHEMPTEVRRKTVAEALRVTKPGGKLIFVDYHKPKAWSPFRYLMVPVLTTLEPFAMDVWNHEITEWLPEGAAIAKAEKKTYFGGLYQKVVFTKAA